MDFPCTQKLDDDLDETFAEEEGKSERKRVGTIVVQDASKQNISSIEFPIYEGDNIIGRHGNCDISIPEGVALSKKHACIEATVSMAFVYDCGSSNKTRLKSMRLKPEVRYAIADGDELCFANIKCTFRQFKEEDKKQSPHNIFESVPETPFANKTGEPLAVDTPASELSAGKRNDSHQVDDSVFEYSEIVPDSQPCSDQMDVNDENPSEVVDESLLELNANHDEGSYLHKPSLPELSQLSQEPLMQSKTRKKLVIESDSDTTDIEENDSEDLKQKSSSVQEADQHYDSDTDVEESSPVIDPYDEETDVEEDRANISKLDLDLQRPSGSKPTVKFVDQKPDAIPVTVDSDDTDIHDSINDSFSILETQAYFSKPNPTGAKQSETNASLANDSFAELETQAFASPKKTSCVIGEGIKSPVTEKDLVTKLNNGVSPAKNGLTTDDSFAELETQAFMAKSTHLELNKSNASDNLADESFSALETQAYVTKKTECENQTKMLDDSVYDAETQAYDPDMSINEVPDAKTENPAVNVSSDESDFEDSLLASMQTQKYETLKPSLTTENNKTVTATTIQTDLDLPSSHEFFASSLDSPVDSVVCEDTEPILPSQSESSVTYTSDLVDTPEFAYSLESENDHTLPVIAESQSFQLSLKSQLQSTLEDTQPVNDDKIQYTKTSTLQETLENTVTCINEDVTIGVIPDNEELNVGKNENIIERDVLAHRETDDNVKAVRETTEDNGVISDAESKSSASSKAIDNTCTSVSFNDATPTLDVTKTITDNKPDDCKPSEPTKKGNHILNENEKDVNTVNKAKCKDEALPDELDKTTNIKIHTDNVAANGKNSDENNMEICLNEEKLDCTDNRTIVVSKSSVEISDDMETQVYSLESDDDGQINAERKLPTKGSTPIVLIRSEFAVDTEGKSGETELRNPEEKSAELCLNEPTVLEDDNSLTQVYSLPSFAENAQTTLVENLDDDIMQTQVYSEESLANTKTVSGDTFNQVSRDVSAKVDSNNNETGTLHPKPARRSVRARKSSKRLSESKMEPSPLTTRSRRKNKTVSVASESVQQKTELKNNIARKSKDASTSKNRSTRTKKQKKSTAAKQIKKEVDIEFGECSINPQPELVKIQFQPDSVKAESPQEDKKPAINREKRSRKRKKIMNDSVNESDSSTTAKKIKNESDENDIKRSASLSLRPRRSKPKIMFTGVVDKIGESIILSLGGSLTDDMHECTHLVTDKIRRTVKFLCAMVRGIHIVSPLWLRESNGNGRFVGEEDFQLHHDPNKSVDDSPPVDLESQYNFNLSSSLCTSRSRKEPLFFGFSIHVMKSVLPPPDHMHQILVCGGAEVVKKLPRARDEEQWKTLVVIATEKDEKACVTALKHGAKVVSNEFVLTGILRQELELDKFSLFADCNAATTPPSGEGDETKMSTRGRSKATTSKKPVAKRKRKT
uniref:Mediator of DNA damage checkpoint protein 1 n=1 Tax=Phallusia mammillata TaxID=59560 RepID=A0A6F9DL49_9ASCI|nr:mediator of DNA damage checkpoint protein 1-like [Phallusia mammillata]